MARYIYRLEPTEHGPRLFRRPSAATKAAAKAALPDFTALTKDELVEAAEARKLDSSGTKADIIERLEANG